MIGKGTKLYKGVGEDLATATFTLADAIANIRSIGEQTTTIDEIETTDLDSGDYKEFEAALKDNGSIQVSGKITADNYSVFKASEGVLLPYAIAHPSLTDVNIKFMAWVSEITRGEITAADEVTFTATLRISGKVEDFEEPIA